MNISIAELNRLGWESRTEDQKNNIQVMINVIQKSGSGYPSVEELKAFQAQNVINTAQRKIRDLQLEIEKQETIICDAEKTIRRFKRCSKIESKEKIMGRPVISEFNHSIAKKFVSKWVRNLMEILEITSCKQLELLIDPSVSRSNERNWRRWLKGEAVPTYGTYEGLLGARVEMGIYKGKLIQDLPTSPNPQDLQTLLRFI